MADKKRLIEIFSAGCAVCEDAVRQVKEAACPSCDVRVLDMKLADVERKAAALGVRSLPAVAVDGKLAECCATRGVDLDVLRQAGLGRAMT